MNPVNPRRRLGASAPGTGGLPERGRDRRAASFDSKAVSGPVADVADGVLPVTTTVFGEGGEVVGEILIWVADGRFAAVEHPWCREWLRN